VPESGVPLARTTIQAITTDEMSTAEVQEGLKAFDKALLVKIGD
jgi:hypothetical protein